MGEKAASAVDGGVPSTAIANLHLYSVVGRTSRQAETATTLCYRTATAEPGGQYNTAAKPGADGLTDQPSATPTRLTRPAPRYPLLYQLNTRVHLTNLSASLGRPATLDDIADGELDRLAGLGFDWVWLLSVWQTGSAGQIVSRSNRAWRQEFAETLPDLREADIAGSGFAITAYLVSDSLGGEDALARLRDRMRLRGLRLMLDFVPNHTAIDHPWVRDHPDYFVQGTEDDIARTPSNYFRIKRQEGDRLFAHGRDPYFAGWPDTIQLNYASPATQEAMINALRTVARHCDGVRCDMAMLLLPDVFQQTWGLSMEPFWARAIESIRRQKPEFCFMAEVYWDREWTLLQQGFDYAYDKRLYDRLRAGQARPVHDCICRPGSTTRANSPVSSRTTTSRGLPRRLCQACTRQPLSSPIFHRVCGSSTRASSRDKPGASRHT